MYSDYFIIPSCAYAGLRCKSESETEIRQEKVRKGVVEVEKRMISLVLFFSLSRERRNETESKII